MGRRGFGVRHEGRASRLRGTRDASDQSNDWPGRRRSLDPPELRAAAKRERNIIERVNAWLKNWRAVATCYCRSAATYLATLTLAVAAINSRA